MPGIKEKIIQEVEKIPKDKITELYDVIHFFRIGIESRKKEVKDRSRAALKFFGIWEDMSPEEAAALDEIGLRRQKTFRKRVL
jgi:hypothetical protein